MTAEEMFEELGYKRDKNEWNIKYIKELACSHLIIDFRVKGDDSFKKYNDDAYAIPISPSELKAINKQVEELGW